jgi:hypothetical protein
MLWNSPTLMTWASQFARVGSLLFVLPLVLNRFTAAEVAVWYLFAGVISLSAMADFGFRSTFIRLTSFAAGGATEIKGRVTATRRDHQQINWSLVERLHSTMYRVYSWTTVLVVLALVLLGTLALWRPIAHLTDQSDAWLAWGVICLTTALEFPGKIYKNYLEGLSFVALVKRVETLFRVAAILSTIAVMTVAPGLLNLVVVNRLWVVANFFRDRYLARAVHDGRMRTFRKLEVDRAFLGQVWAPAWRSGISTVMSKGLLGLSGVLYAQIGSPVTVASYLLALRLITAIRDVCNAPFYSKIPSLGRLRAEGDGPRLVKVAQRGMQLANLTFFAGTVAVGLLATPLLAIIGSKTHFVPLSLWWLIAIGFLGHRVSAFFMHLYLTTNHVISHIVDGAAGIVFGVTAVLLLPAHGVYAFPIGMILAYTGVHTVVSVRYAYRSLPLTPEEFTRRFLIIPSCLLIGLGLLLTFSLF